MATKIEAAELLTRKAAKLKNNNEPVTTASAIAKYYASEVAVEVSTEAVQIFGGYGYMKEYPVEKMMRDAKITQIYEGTNQIQREVIALNVLKEQIQQKG